MLNGGRPLWIAPTGLGRVAAALGTNIDMLFKHGFDPVPFGGILGVTYAAWPPAPPPPVVVPAPEPVVEETPRRNRDTPAPAPPPPPRPAPRETTDEILFDGKARV